MGVSSIRLGVTGALVGLALPCVGLADARAPSGPVATQAPGSPGVLTLYSEPGLKGRHASYKAASSNVEHQGFVARSAASIGMWTLCEGGEVASRCQTVDGQAPELKLQPQIVRPGLNALALYDRPGLKGERIIYSFPADRPAPFHARSARTWGGPWSLCDRGFKHCQTLEGRTDRLDQVVAAVRPEAPAPVTQISAAPPRVERVDAPARKAAPFRPVRLTQITSGHRKISRPPTVTVHETHTHAVHTVRRSVLVTVHEPRRVHRDVFMRHPHPSWTVRFHPAQRHAPHARLLRQVAERHSHRVHAFHRRLYRRVHLAWGGPDPYLYDVEPRGWGPPPSDW